MAQLHPIHVNRSLKGSTWESSALKRGVLGVLAWVLAWRIFKASIIAYWTKAIQEDQA